MSNLIAADSFTGEQIQLIKGTIAKGATDDELKLFLYRCKTLGLDPLKPGMIHFVKYGSNPGTIVVGIEGFRARAATTGKLSGVKRGVLRDEKGQCTGGWCEVYRSDWKEPAREEVSLHEYNTGKAMWAKMPETMIKKVAEAAALRMAFADELGGVYATEEMDQADTRRPYNPDVNTQTAIDLAIRPTEKPAKPDTPPPTAGEHVVRIGKKYVGQMLKDIGVDEVVRFAKWIEKDSDPGFKSHPDTKEFLTFAYEYVKEFELDELDQALANKNGDERS